MITIKDFMEVVNYRITEGSEHGWNCYGDNSYSLTSWNGDNDNGYSAEIIFDTDTQLVYEMTACDYEYQRAYRWIHPDYRTKYATTANAYLTDPKQAWDDVNYIDIEVEEDMLEKTRAIVAGQEYDTRIKVPIDLPDDDLFKLMIQAHEKDITLNNYVSSILTQMVNENENAK